MGDKNFTAAAGSFYPHPVQSAGLGDKKRLHSLTPEQAEAATLLVGLRRNARYYVDTHSIITDLGSFVPASLEPELTDVLAEIAQAAEVPLMVVGKPFELVLGGLKLPANPADPSTNEVLRKAVLRELRSFEERARAGTYQLQILDPILRLGKLVRGPLVASLEAVAVAAKDWQSLDTVKRQAALTSVSELITEVEAMGVGA